MTGRRGRSRLQAYRQARVLTASLATGGFAFVGLVEPLAWPLVVGSGLVAVVALVEMRNWFANPNIPVLADAVIIFTTIYIARPFPGVEAAGLAYVMSTAVVFATGPIQRWVLPAVTGAALIVGVLNWVVRDPPGWSEGAMFGSAIVAVVALGPVLYWLGTFIARAFPEDNLFNAVIPDPGDFANVVTERSSEGIVVIDFDSNIRYANPAFAATFGFQPEDLVGKTMAVVMDAETYRRHHSSTQVAYMSGRLISAENMELVGRHRDGRPVTVLVSISELEGDGERLVLGAVRDVSEIVRLRARLEQLVHAKDEFIATVSHELRTPLTAVVAFSEMLASPDQLDPAERDEFIGLIAEQSREVSYLVEDLLVAARLESDSVTVNVVPTHLRPEVVASVSGWATRHSIEIDHASLASTVLVDPGRFRQILRNLVSNAVKYGGSQVGVSAIVQNGMCHVVVWDDGPGVPESLEPSLFEPFEHSGDVDGQPFSMGLGLYVSRRLAEAMGGTLEHHRRDDQTEFVLVVPLADESRPLADPGR
jgi:PAS domain S-box-containing protein